VPSYHYCFDLVEILVVEVLVVVRLVVVEGVAAFEGLVV